MSRLSRVWIRRLTAVAMMLLVAVSAALIVQRVRRFSTPIEQLAEQVLSGGGDRAVGVYTGFEYVERVAGELIFELASERTLGLSSGWHEIEGVRLQFYRDGEEGATLTCETASFNVETRDAKLSGRIRIDLPSGAVFMTDAGEFEASSRQFSTRSPVDFVHGSSFGRAGGVDYDLARQRILLTEGVRLIADDGTALVAPEAVYDRQQHTIDFPRGGDLSSQSTTLRAPSILLELEGLDRPPERIQMSGGVVVDGFEDGQGHRFEAWLEHVVATKDRRGRWQIDATTTRRWLEIRFFGSEGYFERMVRAWVLRGVVDRSGILNLRGEQGVCVREIPSEGSPRSGEARNARIWFKNGAATDIELVDEVILRDEELRARAFRARLSPSAGLAMLHGDPAGPERVVLDSDRGQISCDRAQLFNNQDRAEARGNVQGVIRDVSLMGTNSGEGERGSVHFAAETLEVRERGSEHHLRDNARVWQGHRLLLADDVVYRHDATRIQAAGHVRTTMPASSLDANADPTADVVVVSRSLEYDSDQGRAVYRGNVNYSDPDYTLSAAELTIFFDADNEVTAVEAVGSVDLVELESGRRMTGQRARREVATRMVSIEGSPVRLTEPSGNAVSGSSLTWNQADGTVTVTGGTETIYYAEEAP